MRISRFIPTCALTACAAVASAQTFTLVHVFHGTDGADPEAASIVEDSGGNLYSTTAFGGSSGLGTVYKINRKGNNKETVLHNFTGSSDGETPNAGVLLGSDGNLYGTADQGGTNGFGTAYRVTPAGAFNAFYEFQGGAQASGPGRLIGVPGALYGSAGGGAPFYGGMVYRLDSSGETDLYKFAGGADGSSGSWLVRDGAGNFYGTGGGGDLTCSPPGGCGVIYKID